MPLCVRDGFSCEPVGDTSGLLFERLELAINLVVEMDSFVPGFSLSQGIGSKTDR